ncbi:MAG: hypothetical protein IJW82_04000 [Clostridia bacterium]|nr:hypothetical protein [Clostridia bacterium]
MKKINVLFLFSIILFNILFCFGCNKKRYSITNSQNAVIEITIFSSNGKKESKGILRNHGHSFFAFTNISQDFVKIGNYNLSPNETITLGTWSITSHFGVWYNLESSYIKDYDKYNDRVSVSTQIDSNEVKVVNEFIKNHDTWNPYSNCSYFCINLWNTFANNEEIIKKPLFYNPSYLYNQITSFPTYENNKMVTTKENFGYFENEFVSHSFLKELSND